MSYPLELIDAGFVVKTAKEMKDVPEKEDEQDPDAWSTQHGPLSSPESAKFSDETPNDQTISKAPPHRIFRHGLVSGNTTAGTTDDEIMTKWVSNHSSASSSISWAEDAVEAEMTKKIFLLWEDIQRVCSGEVELKPEGMPSALYVECLNWKRAFPVQDLSRFSRFSEEDSTPTPTKEQDGNYFLTTAIFPSQSPDSPNPYCLTPIMENHSTVDLWLSDCQSQGVLTGSDYSNQLDAGIQSFSMLDNRSDNDPDSLPSIIAPPKTNNFIRNPNKPDVVPDPHNFFTSLALENVVESADRMSSPDSYKCHGDIRRVQRPVSSSARGHLITPLPTKNRQLSRSFREMTSHQRHQTTTAYDSEISTTTITNEFEHIMSLNGNRLLGTAASSKGRLGLPFLPNHVHNESSNIFGPSGLHGSASGHPGSPSGRLNSASGQYGSPSGLHGSASGQYGPASGHQGSASGHLGSAPTPPRGSSFGSRNPASGYCRSSYGKKMKATAAGSPSGSNGRVCSKILENGTNSTVASSRFSSGASSHRAPNWSRHSSITETYSFQITPDGSSSSSNTKIIDNQFFETNTFQSITERTTTSSTMAAAAPESNIKATRPNFLPTQARDAERQRPRQSKGKPVRPFLYWLLDKVSPS